MKTPREILLEQHRSAEPRLDALHQQVVAAELANQSAVPAPVPSPSPFRFRCSMLDVRCLFSALLWLPVKLWMELVWPCRRIWAGLAAVWVLVFLLNLDFGAPTGGMAANRGPTTNPWSMAALKEQQQIMSQLLDAETPASEPAPKPGPRGDIQATTGWAVAGGHHRSADSLVRESEGMAHERADKAVRAPMIGAFAGSIC